MSKEKTFEPFALRHRIYINGGNLPLIALIGARYKRLLDVGCGAGDNAALIKAEYPECQLFGISCSVAEAKLASRYMVQCWVYDIERGFPSDLVNQSFDTIIFSHVLEHLREPAVVLARFINLLSLGGEVLIAVPNVLLWRHRIQFLMGRFEYETAGVLDDTHLHFYTYLTADRYLLPKSCKLELVNKSVSGGVPLGLLRKYVLSKVMCRRIDTWGCRRWPNWFGEQILIKAVKKRP